MLSEFLSTGDQVQGEEVITGRRVRLRIEFDDNDEWQFDRKW